MLKSVATRGGCTGNAEVCGCDAFDFKVVHVDTDDEERTHTHRSTLTRNVGLKRVAKAESVHQIGKHASKAGR